MSAGLLADRSGGGALEKLILLGLVLAVAGVGLHALGGTANERLHAQRDTVECAVPEGFGGFGLGGCPDTASAHRGTGEGGSSQPFAVLGEALVEAPSAAPTAEDSRDTHYPPGGHRVQDATAGEVEAVRGAIDRASELVDGALESLGDPDSLDPGARGATRIALERHFGIEAGAEGDHAEEIDRIREVFTEAREAIDGGLKIEVEYESHDAVEVDGQEARIVAYVYRLWIWPVGDIHLGPDWFKFSPDERAGILLHEITHRYSGTEDHAYDWQSEYGRLSPGEAVDNADSYSEYALEVEYLKDNVLDLRSVPDDGAE